MVIAEAIRAARGKVGRVSLALKSDSRGRRELLKERRSGHGSLSAAEYRDVGDASCSAPSSA